MEVDSQEVEPTAKVQDQPMETKQLESSLGNFQTYGAFHCQSTYGPPKYQ